MGYIDWSYFFASPIEMYILKDSQFMLTICELLRLICFRHIQL